MHTTCRIEDFISPVRKLTKDEGTTPYRDDATICRAVVDAFRRLHSVRPESRYDSQGLLADVEFPTDDDALAAFEVGVEVAWRLGIAYYAAARCYEEDITDSVNLQLAQMLFQKAAIEFQTQK